MKLLRFPHALAVAAIVVLALVVVGGGIVAYLSRSAEASNLPLSNISLVADGDLKINRTTGGLPISIYVFFDHVITPRYYNPNNKGTDCKTDGTTGTDYDGKSVTVYDINAWGNASNAKTYCIGARSTGPSNPSTYTVSAVQTNYDLTVTRLSDETVYESHPANVVSGYHRMPNGWHWNGIKICVEFTDDFHPDNTIDECRTFN